MNDKSASQPPNQPHWSLRRGVSTAITAGVLVALLVIVLVVVLTRGSATPPAFPNSILSVTPAPDAQAPRQGPIGARLAQGWTATITIEGARIPDSQLDAGTRELNEFFFAPGPDKVIEVVQPGRTCVELVTTPLVDTNSPVARYSWCFTAV